MSKNDARKIQCTFYWDVLGSLNNDDGNDNDNTTNQEFDWLNEENWNKRAARAGRGLQKYKRLVSPSNWVSLKTDIARIAIRAISVFRVKFDVEFTRQAVNFSVEWEQNKQSENSRKCANDCCSDTFS